MKTSRARTRRTPLAGVGLLGREVGDDEPFDAGSSGALDEGTGAGARGFTARIRGAPRLAAVLVNEVVVRHADERRLNVHLLREREEPVRRHPGVERADQRP